MGGILLSGASSRHGRPKIVQSIGRWLDAAIVNVTGMGKPLQRSPGETFVVRISIEGARETQGRWRATVVHVTSGERRYVSSYGELCGFIEARRHRSGTADVSGSG